MSKKENVKVAISEKNIGFEAPLVVSQIAENCLYSGFFGRLDSARMKNIIDHMLEAVDQTANESIIVDLSSVDVIDSAVAAQLLKVGNTLKLVGAKVIFCGINSTVAQSMVVADIEFEKYHTSRDLQSALTIVYKDQGLKLVPINDESDDA